MQIKFSALLVLFISFQSFSANLIEWQDLIPAPIKTIELPALTQQQVTHLYSVLKYDDNAKSRDMTAEETKEYLLNKKVLQDAGFDADELLAKREEALEIERIRLTTVNTDLNLDDVTIPGFVVPLEMDGMLTTQFLLVPIAGACIHTPPPPANQTIIVDIDSGFALQDLYKVVMVSGDIEAYEQDLPISFIDGTEVVSTGYTMSAQKVTYL
ncbi:DUF3299 domain-containing protein [Vibrio methylphosphonaticus]|uniref:DUF3299 domain-containing protein n=1 Tax=Vibrio methylphosphonaticus TaxID=2946866 RepID=UPI00202AA51D|nr:DUF3299 domain-containing protein [Vibrio methylphosphonaticus]MCL9773765.1 DUF3299 domain-containing protein [Vibrio methylphosphonaticus]